MASHIVNAHKKLSIELPASREALEAQLQSLLDFMKVEDGDIVEVPRVTSGHAFEIFVCDLLVVGGDVPGSIWFIVGSYDRRLSDDMKIIESACARINSRTLESAIAKALA